jgi:hypothetical protein
MPPLRGTGRQSLRRVWLQADWDLVRPQMVLHSLASYRCGVCGRIGRSKRVEPVLMSRCISGVALACTATALAACGAVPREDRSERSPLPRTFPVEMQSLASCALERLGKKHGKIQKTDFPDRYMVRLRRETDSVTLWDIDLIAVDQESTRVAIVIPPKVENVQPDQLFADLETCAVPPAGGARAPR